MKFTSPELKLMLFDTVCADATSAYGQAADALRSAGATHIGEADWENDESWSFDSTLGN